jgi:hypothetical protein
MTIARSLGHFNGVCMMLNLIAFADKLYAFSLAVALMNALIAYRLLRSA